MVIVITGAYEASGLFGVEITNLAFNTGISFIPYIGEFVVNLTLILFAYTTIVGWCYYGQRSVAYLFGERAVFFYKIAYVLILFIGIFVDLSLIISLADIFNAIMIIPNLIGLLLLAKLVSEETKGYNKLRRNA